MVGNARIAGDQPLPAIVTLSDDARATQQIEALQRKCDNAITKAQRLQQSR